MAGHAQYFRAWAALVLGLGLIRLPILAQTVELDSFDQDTVSGAPATGTSWTGNITQQATSIQVGGTAKDENGWVSASLNLDASAMNYLRILAQRDTGNESPAVVVQFNDLYLTQDAGVFSVGSDAFAAGELTWVQVPIDSWGAGFDASQITDWSLGGGATGLTDFRMTFAHLALSSDLLALSGGKIITAGDQTYAAAQSLTGDTTLGNTDGANGTGTAITFDDSLDGAYALTLNTNGVTTLDGAAGGTTPLASLTTDAGGRTEINGGEVTTTGDQSYGDEVHLGADTLLQVLGDGIVQFFQPIQGNDWELTINSPNWGTFGAAHQLAALNKSGSGTFVLSSQSTFTGPTTVNAGTLQLDVDQALSASSSLVLAGGTFDLNQHSLTLSTLAVTADSILDFGGGSGSFTLSSISGSLWNGTLSISNFNPSSNTLRFGTGSDGLNLANLPLFRFVDYGGAIGQIDGLGFVTPSAVPEPGTVALLAGVAVLGATVYRRRRLQQLAATERDADSTAPRCDDTRSSSCC
ncbi:autotransporter-associated beta strand repeat-containing protein [Actomonas aquatica]|uniref:Autotransporter-associated beta strand repeat-containing protein n=1 Tax=Actomonas aquatica TaxID=2866162 RepID=A0ABZ1C5T0_9BACT|nr:autotransporter-associated beta strand repeat-containing protein [Opitutus sp. WL0086]WRQ86718.1 autotransporter-associated beta strand repeat-containing protein [Opitutus sp. WL0086]